MSASAPDYRPSFPAEYRPGSGSSAAAGSSSSRTCRHTPITAWTWSGSTTRLRRDATAIRERFPVVGGCSRRLDELLDDPRIEVVDIATHPAERLELMRRALEAGKHVLSQKPLRARPAGAARELVEDADRHGLRLAVNQNGRWAPAWRIATLLVQQGAIGEVCAVTHLYEHDFDWMLGDWPDELEHFVIYDFSGALDRHHALLAGREDDPRRPGARVPDPGAARRRARRRGAPGSPSSTRTGRARRFAASARRATRPGNPFWIHGSEGTIRGSVRKGPISSSWSATGPSRATRLVGEWMPDGFAGTMGELCSRDRRGPRAVQLGAAQPPLPRAHPRGVSLGRAGRRAVGRRRPRPRSVAPAGRA